LSLVLFRLYVVLLLASTKWVSCCYFCCCCFVLCFCSSKRRTRGRDLECHRNNNSHRFLQSTSIDYGFCTNFIVYARDFEVREDEKKCHVTCEHVKNDSFHFHFFFSDHVTSISSVRRRNRLLYARTFSLDARQSENETSLNELQL
jgi:hypothetical protein